MSMTKSIRFLVCSALALGLASPALAWSQVNDSEKPGSVLVFPKFIRGTFNDVFVTGQALHARTELEISVRCPDGATCTDGQVVRMRAHWVCGGCAESSFNLETTVNGSLYFNTEGVSVVDVAGVPLITAAAFPSNATTVIVPPPPGCLRGYLIVWAIDNTSAGNPIKFDGLIGDAILRDGTPGEEANSARAYNAVPIQASENIATTDPPSLTDVDGDGNLDFDGNEYQSLTGRIFGTVRYEDPILVGGVVQTDLTLLTLDVRSNLVNPRTDVKLNFYSTDEGIADAAVNFLCWTELRLTAINPNFTDATMGRKGLVESDGPATQFDFATGVTTDATVLGIVYTREGSFSAVTPFINSFRDYAYSLYHDGNPVPTEFVP
jgi:hypothetical protein